MRGAYWGGRLDQTTQGSECQARSQRSLQVGCVGWDMRGQSSQIHIILDLEGA